MKNDWIQIAYLGNEWSNTTVYINPSNETAKVHKSKISHWGYHDDSEWDESEEIISIEKALAIVYPDEEAISLIKRFMGKDYAKVLDELDKKSKPVPQKIPEPPVQEEKPKAWKPIYDAASALNTFKTANERYLQGDAYQKLLEMLSCKYHQLDRTIDTNPKWEDGPKSLRITGRYHAWSYHDESITETIEMNFERLWKGEWDEPEVWSVESDWSCTGQHQYLSEHKDTGDHWNYNRMTHNAWLLKEPFGLPGVWSFEYKTTNSKG